MFRMLEQMRLTVEQNLRRMKWKHLGLQRKKGKWGRKRTECGNGGDKNLI